MPVPLRRLTSALSALLLLAAALLASLALAAPASAVERVITITADGIDPKVLQVADGDTVKFVTPDRTFAYRAQSTSDNWTFDSGPVGLLDGEYVVSNPDGTPLVLTDPGTYTFRVAQGDQFAGSVVLPAPGSSPQPAAGTTAAPGGPAAPPPAGSPAPGGNPAPSASAAGPTGGAGTAQAPPLTGGFGPLETPQTSAPGGIALPPALAPPPLLGAEPLGPAPATAPVPEASVAPLTEPAVAGDLAGMPSPRRLGLPAALAALLAVGVTSLLVRALLAEPAARAVRTGFSTAAPAVAVD